MENKVAIDFWFKLPHRITFKCLNDSFCNDYDNTFKITKKALEKQIPITPTHITKENDVKIGSFIFRKGCKIYSCICGQWVGYKDSFCKYCGQKLDWN